MTENRISEIEEQLPAASEELLSMAELLCATEQEIDEKRLPALIHGLIAIYDDLFAVDIHRRRAARVTAVLAMRFPKALEFVRQNARRYSEILRTVDDADPYSPNSCEVLAEIGKEVAVTD